MDSHWGSLARPDGRHSPRNLKSYVEEDSSVAKSTYFSCRGPKLIAPILEACNHLELPSGLSCHLSGIHTQTRININKSLFFLLKRQIQKKQPRVHFQLTRQQITQPDQSEESAVSSWGTKYMGCAHGLWVWRLWGTSKKPDLRILILIFIPDKRRDVKLHRKGEWQGCFWIISDF